MAKEEFVSWAFAPVGIESEKRTPLRTITGQNLEVTGLHIELSEKYGQFIVINSVQGDYFTFSKLIIAQVKQVGELLQRAKRVRVGIGMNTQSQNLFVAPYASQSNLIIDELEEEI